MLRQCARPGCSAVATTTFTFDSRERTVWLDPPQDGAARAGELCARHARALAPPLGWHVVDRRDNSTSSPAPVAPPANPVVNAPAAAAPEMVAPVASVVTLPPPAPYEAPRLDLGLLASIPPTAPVAPAAPAEPVAWYPRFERGDSLDGVLEATTPLLARAFGNVRAI
jgi:hypothetical protein